MGIVSDAPAPRDFAEGGRTIEAAGVGEVDDTRQLALRITFGPAILLHNTTTCTAFEKM